MQLRVAGIGLLAVAIAVTTLFAALGLWQLDRAEQKRATFAEFERRGQASQVDINLREVGDGTALSGYRPSSRGPYIRASILPDNPLDHGRALARKPASSWCSGSIWISGVLRNRSLPRI